MSKIAQKDGDKSLTVVNACNKTTANTKPWDTGTKSQADLWKPTKWRNNKIKNTLGLNGVLFIPQLEHPTRYQRVHIQNLDKLTALGWLIIRRAKRPLPKQLVPPRKQNDRGNFFSSERDQESCDLKREIQNDTVTVYHVNRSQRSINIAFQVLLLRCHVHNTGCCNRIEPGWQQTLMCEKTHHCPVTPVPVRHSLHRCWRHNYTHNTFLLHLHCYQIIDWLSRCPVIKEEWPRLVIFGEIDETLRHQRIRAEDQTVHMNKNNKRTQKNTCSRQHETLPNIMSPQLNAKQLPNNSPLHQPKKPLVPLLLPGGLILIVG